jgi:hypothetical protein
MIFFPHDPPVDRQYPISNFQARNLSACFKREIIDEKKFTVHNVKFFDSIAWFLTALAGLYVTRGLGEPTLRKIPLPVHFL